jgi:hypothetical protein
VKNSKILGIYENKHEQSLAIMMALYLFSTTVNVLVTQTSQLLSEDFNKIPLFWAESSAERPPETPVTAETIDGSANAISETTTRVNTITLPKPCLRTFCPLSHLISYGNGIKSLRSKAGRHQKGG